MSSIHKYKILIAGLGLLCMAALLVGSCSKKPTDYRSYLGEAEKIYPGVLLNLETKPGDGRLLLTWQSGSDPSITRYVVYWNNGADSSVVDVKTGSPSDTVEAYIDGLNEGSYNFVIHSFDARGNKSIPTQVENAKVYGGQYRDGLLNRPVQRVQFANDMLQLDWGVPDTVNITTQILYTDVLGQEQTLWLHPDSSRTEIDDWKLASPILYRSYYKPQQNAIDTFAVLNYDSLAVDILPADKSIWKKISLLNDADVEAFGTALSNLWDGQVGDVSTSYHSDDVGMPHHFSFDLGTTYNELTRFAEWGRADFADHNPTELEVWGIADTTGAATTLLPADAGWAAQSVAKGWTLLATVNRSDDGIAGVETDIVADPPPVRFIRIRVLKNAGNTNYSHMSEVSFFFRP